MNIAQTTKAITVLGLMIVVIGSFERAPVAIEARENLAASGEFSDAVTGPVSKDPHKDILEISRAFAALHGVEACSLAKSMNAVFGVECNFNQNCGGGTRYIGSFQQGVPYMRVAEEKLGEDLVAMNDLVASGDINQGVYTHMLAAVEQGRSMGTGGRLHHMYATMLALVEHVRMERALQARSTDQATRAGAHVVFQFSPPNVREAVNTGKDRESSWGTRNGIPSDATVFEAIDLASSGAYKHADKVHQGIQGINCNTEAGYTGPSGERAQGSFLTNVVKSTPLGRFLGLHNPQTQSYQDGYLDPSRNPALRPENDPSQRARNPQSADRRGSQRTSRDASFSILDRGERGDDSVQRDRTGLSGFGTEHSDNAVDRALNNIGGVSENAAGVAQGKLNGRLPALLCVPETLEANERALIMWACRDSAHTTQSEHFDSNQAVRGATVVSPSDTTTYTLTCVNDDEAVAETSASCTVNVAEPGLALLASQDTVSVGGSVELAWTSRDTNSCSLSSDRHENFARNGVSGDADSPPITEDTTFTLECESITGSISVKRITVIVE